MELQITQENQNPLFNRKEIQFKLEAEVTPSEKEITELIAQKFSSQPENISVKGIHGKFGSKTFTINANIYESAEEKQAIENKKKKGAESKEEAPTETPAQAPVTETPVEAPAQEKTEAKQEEPKQEAEKQELAKPDEKPTQESKVDAKEE